mmetsp:Transcript_21081/g.70232  ORF Transcript_21081/g.70232 Transcript_21081/m.70232 type:complete len:220 (-) Transcript_21081:1754-2413(-)
MSIGMSSLCCSSISPLKQASSAVVREISFPSASTVPPSHSCGRATSSLQSELVATTNRPPRSTSPSSPTMLDRQADGELTRSRICSRRTTLKRPRSAEQRFSKSAVLNVTRVLSTKESVEAMSSVASFPSSLRENFLCPSLFISSAACTKCSTSTPTTSENFLASSNEAPPTEHPKSSTRLLATLSFAAQSCTSLAMRRGKERALEGPCSQGSTSCFAP